MGGDPADGVRGVLRVAGNGDAGQLLGVIAVFAGPGAVAGGGGPAAGGGLDVVDMPDGGFTEGRAAVLVS